MIFNKFQKDILMVIMLSKCKEYLFYPERL